MIRLLRSRSHRTALVALLVACASVAEAAPAGMPAQPLAGPIWSMQLHGGMFKLNDGNGTSSMIGTRYCKHYTPQFYGGLLTSWTYKSTSLSQPSLDPANPGPRVELAQVNAQLIPVMAFVQVDLTEKTRIRPLFGIGAGYEWLALDVKDHRDGSDSRPTYGNFAWEAWGGLALRLNEIWRLNGELYYNGGALQRHVTDDTGHRWI